MTGALEVLSPGTFTTVQDLGRTGYLSAGVPPSGALDPVALRLANVVAGNEQSAAGLEILHSGPEFRVEVESVRLVCAGAEIEVLEPEAGSHPQWCSVTLARGTRFRIGPLRETSSAYLAISGGLELELCLGSFSTYVRGGFGGYEGGVLQAGDRILLASASAPDTGELALERQPGRKVAGQTRIRVVMGPQHENFTEEGLETLCTGEFTVSRNFDRMGARLDGPKIDLKSHENFISDGITAGAIQVPGSGQAIVLLADHQTTGGYPKIATVISADLPLFGRLRPGSKITFEAISIEAAEAARHDLEKEIAALAARVAPLAAKAEINLERLYSENLISGVTG